MTAQLRRVSFEVVGIAEPKGSMRAFMRPGLPPVVTSANPRVKDWQNLVAVAAGSCAAEGLFPDAVRIDATFYLPRPRTLHRRIQLHTKRPDLDKLLRSTLDALSGVLFHDDAQVIEIRASKVYTTGAGAPHAIITVEEAAPPPTTLAQVRALFDNDTEGANP